MANEVLGWMSDLGAYGKVILEWRTQRKPGKGFDYLSQEYRDLVRKTVERIHPRRMRLKVVEVIQETASTKTFRLKRADGDLPPFRPGQYVNLFVTIDGVLTSRPYSISSAPGAGHIDLTVRDKQGGFVAPYLLNHIKPGDELETTGPAGSFYYEPLIDGKDLVFLAGGSGITPFMSIIRDQAARKGDLKIQLVYGSRWYDDVIFHSELERHGISYTQVLSEPPDGYQGERGFLDAGLISRVVGEVRGKTFYICGPNAMYDLCQRSLVDLGVPGHKIRRELYGPPDDVTKEPGWPQGLSPDAVFKVDVQGAKTIEARAGEPLICSLERNGIVVPSVCRSGECSACRTKVVSGRVFMPARAGVRQSDRECGYVHACVAYPVEDIVVRL